jgi:hypothetical protein
MRMPLHRLEKINWPSEPVSLTIDTQIGRKVVVGFLGTKGKFGHICTGMLPLRRYVFNALATGSSRRTLLHSSQPIAASSAHASNSKEYPKAPNVGIGVVILRNDGSNNEEVVLSPTGGPCA